MIRRLASRALDWRFRAVVGRLDELGATCERLEELLEERIEPMLRAVFAEEAENRRRLFAARASADYESAYTEPDTLVSVTVATRDRPELLLDRALPSLLGQSHRNVEVIVVGDAALDDLDGQLRALGDPRLRYSNLTQRTVAHRDPEVHQLVGSTLARNEAARLARGLWLMHFDDDDALREDAIETLLGEARTRRLEVAYGGFEVRGTGEGVEPVAQFPPAAGRFGWQGALIHSSLRFFERELAASAIPLPGDVFLLERMLRVGVRFGMSDRVVWDYYPSMIYPTSAISQTVVQMSSMSPADISP